MDSFDLEQVFLRDGLVSFVEDFFERTEHQGKRSAELVADVRKENGLRAIEFSERFGAATFLFIGTGAGECGGDLSPDQLDESGVFGVQLAIRVETTNKEASGAILPLALEGNDNGSLRRDLPGTGG